MATARLAQLRPRLRLGSGRRWRDLTAVRRPLAQVGAFPLHEAHADRTCPSPTVRLSRTGMADEMRDDVSRRPLIPARVQAYCGHATKNHVLSAIAICLRLGIGIKVSERSLL
jgi:hypothetical protein